MRYKILGVILPLVVLAVPVSVSANNDILIVPQEEPPIQAFEILDQDLLVNDGGGATVVSHTPASRGDLVRLGPELKFTYAPGTEFWDAGMDSFSYVFDAQSGQRATVFLVADPREDLRMAIDPDLEITTSPFALNLRQGTLGLSNLPDESLTEIRLTADSPASDSLLMASHNPALGRGKPSDSGSGGVELELDPERFSVPSGTRTVLSRVSVNGAVDVELSLSQDGGVNLLTGRCQRDDGTLIDAFSAALDGGLERAVLTWWAASDEQALDGGLILELGNRVVASFSGFDNHNSFDAVDIETHFGAMGATGGSGSLQMGRLKYWQLAEEQPALVPIFADGVESQDTSAWTAVVGDVNVTAAATILGNRGISIAGTFPAYLIDGSPAAERHYRARFNVDPSSLTLADGNELTLLAGFDSAGNAFPFAVKLRQEGVNLKLCAQARLASGASVDVGCSVVATAQSVKVQWWPAPGAAADGGLRLWLASPSLATGSNLIAQRLDLANGGQIIDEARFGVIDPDAGTTGEVHLDDFESWR